VRAINGKLPEDVVVLDATVVSADFDPVRHATRKAYSYTIHNARERSMWDRNYVHHVHEPLDVPAMHAAAQHIIGTHDFVAFAAANHGRLTTVRTVFTCSVTSTPLSEPRAHASGSPEPRAHINLASHHPLPAPPPAGEGAMPQRIRIDITGSGFLYNMVRIIGGTLVEVGRGRIRPDAVPAIIAGKDRRAAGPTLPGRGLCLEWIRYK
jgi:tRNA pseudouridine38-40 synthase